MLAPGLGDWGLGLRVEGAGDALRFEHDGDDRGFKAYLVGYPLGERAIVVMANGDDGLVVIQELVAAVAREYGWKGFEPKIIDAVDLKDAQKDIAGRYGNGSMVVKAEGSVIELRMGPRVIVLIPQGADQFVTAQSGTHVAFKRGTDGKVIGIQGGGAVIPRDP